MHIRRDVHARPSALPRGLGDRPDLQDLQVGRSAWLLSFISSPCSSRVLGTPNEEIWPGVHQLPDYKPSFPHWAAQDLREHVPALNDEGIDLLQVRLLR